MRLYCAIAAAGHSSRADVSAMKENTGLEDDNCFFALSFKYVAGSKTWIVNDTFSTERLWHTHAFYHSYVQKDTSIHSAGSATSMGSSPEY